MERRFVSSIYRVDISLKAFLGMVKRLEARADISDRCNKFEKESLHNRC